MFKRSGLAGSTIALAILLPGSAAFADHVPSKKKVSAQDSARVEERLVGLGVARDAARDEVASMTSPEVAYFAADPARVQVVAGLTSEEFLVGGGFLGLMCLITLFLIANSKGT